MSEETKQTVEYVIGKLHEAAATMEPGARHVYEVLVRQAWAEGLTAAAQCVFAAIIVAMYAYAFPRLMRWLRSSSFDEEPLAVAALICGGTVALLAVAIFLDAAPDAILHLINPEYYAIKDLIGGLK